MPESSPSYPSLLLRCDLDVFQSVHFASDMGHDNQGRSFLAPKDKTTKCRKTDSWSVMFSRKHLEQKGEMWKWIKEDFVHNGVRQPWRRKLSCMYHALQFILYMLRGRSLLYYNSKSEDFPFAPQQPSQWETATSQPLRSSHNPDLWLFFHKLSFKTTPPSFLHSSIKADPSHLFSGSWLCFTGVYKSQTAFPLLFLITLILLLK